MTHQATFVIVGGGIAGVSCAEGLAFLAPEEKIILISPSPTVKTVANLRNLTKLLSEFDVQEKSSSFLEDSFPNMTFFQDSVVKLNPDDHTVQLKSGILVGYEKLCLCTGASPKLIANNPLVVGIRDVDSAEELQKKVASSRKVAVVGNGGIATELVYQLSGIEIVWIIKDGHISSPFLDAGAALFFRDRIKNKSESGGSKERKIHKYTVDGRSRPSVGPSLGPDWHRNLVMHGASKATDNISIEYNCEVKEIQRGDTNWPVYLELTNGKRIGCDFIVSATGVNPNSEAFKTERLELAEDMGVKVNWKMETSLPDIYAAGDVCTASWSPLAPHWFQMRLWTQARHMGTYASKSMVSSIRGEELIQDFSFELFTHVTRFFGTKVILLGLYNGQTLANDKTGYEAIVRVTDGIEYVKLVMINGRMQGALLVGETDLEEMCENLILNQLDLTDFGEGLLNPDIDIDDYFD